MVLLGWVFECTGDVHRKIPDGGLHYHTPPTRNGHDHGVAGKPEVSPRLPGGSQLPTDRPIGSAYEMGLDLV